MISNKRKWSKKRREIYYKKYIDPIWNEYLNTIQGMGARYRRTSGYQRNIHAEELRTWREQVLNKYPDVCQRCGFIGWLNIKLTTHGIHIHHMDGFAHNKERRYDTDNGLVLCKACHNKLHRQYGMRCTSDDAKNFLKK
jgi:predicted HNH restriction endonuclease